MDKPGGNEAVKVLKKGKKKHAKDELDRQKQAEKKRRRLEKALANSAAIISALEKKRQQKKEERERQDEEGAAIAEAVALHVLTGEDSDESCHLMLNKHRRCNHWDDFVGIEPTPGSQEVDAYSSGGLTCPAHVNFPQWRWTDWGISGTCSSREQVMDYQLPYLEETFPQSDGCHGFIAAQAVSSLQIGDHSSEDTFPIQGGGGAAVLNRILSGTNNRLNLYKEL